GRRHPAFSLPPSLLPFLERFLPAPCRLALLPFALFIERYAPVPVGVLLRRSRRLAVAQRLVHFPTHPQPVQQHRQLASHRHHRTLLGVLAAARGLLQPPPLQIRIRTAPAQNTVRRLHQQRAQVHIALLADPQLRLALAGLALLGPQAHIAAHIPALPESFPVLQRQHKRQSDQRSHSAHLPQEFGFRILGPGDLLDFCVRLFNLFRQRFHLLQQRLQRIPQTFRQRLHSLHAHTVGVARRQPLSHGFGKTPRRVH